MNLQEKPIVKTNMLIRKPAAEVFEAIVDPAITTRFWFTRGSGRLGPGATVRWEFEMYGVSIPVTVESMEPGRRILMQWGEPATTVEWLFEPRTDDTTMVTISTWGFAGEDGHVLAAALDSMGGFSFVLAGLKALLEHNVELNLSGDHHPEAWIDRAGLH